MFFPHDNPITIDSLSPIVTNSCRMFPIAFCDVTCVDLILCVFVAVFFIVFVVV